MICKCVVVVKKKPVEVSVITKPVQVTICKVKF